MYPSLQKFLWTLLIMAVTMGSSLYATAWPCDVPDCPESCQQGGGKPALIERTYLQKNKTRHQNKKILASCNTPILEVSIDSQDMAAILAVGNQRIQFLTDTGLVINMDVGVEGEETQFWQLPVLNFPVRNDFLSIPTNSSPYLGHFPGTNVVYRGNYINSDTFYFHSTLGDSSIIKKGQGSNNFGDPYTLDYFETRAFLPIECGWIIDENISTTWTHDTEIDSILEHKNVTIRSTGMLTPINEDPVPAILSYIQYTFRFFKDGAETFTGGYNAMTWFSAAGHMVVGYLAPGAPVEGITTFTRMAYEKNILACPPTQDLGIPLLGGTYRAQSTILSGSSISNGTVNFVAGQDVNLRPDFSTLVPFDIYIVADPCNTPF